MTRSLAHFATSPARLALTLAVVLLTAAAAHAQLPQARLYTVYPPGGQAGQTVEIQITGDDLDDAHELRFDHPNIKAEPVRPEKTDLHPDPQPTPGKFKVTIGGDVPRGIYQVRAVGRFGLTNARAFVVDDRPTAMEANKRSLDDAQPVPMNSTVFGKVDQRAYDVYAIEAKKDQRVLVECIARRLDSKADVTLKLFNPAGIEMQLSRDEEITDALLDFTAPADGKYYVQVYDFTYEGGNEYTYQLRVGDGPYIDFVFPPAGERGKASPFTIYGRNLPGGSPTKLITAQGQPLEQITTDINVPGEGDQDGYILPRQTVVESFAYRLDSPKGASNKVRIGITDARIVAEVEPNHEGSQSTNVDDPC